MRRRISGRIYPRRSAWSADTPGNVVPAEKETPRTTRITTTAIVHRVVAVADDEGVMIIFLVVLLIECVALGFF